LVILAVAGAELPLIAKQQRSNARRLPEQFAEARQRAVNCLNILASSAEAFEGLRRHKFDEQIGRPGGTPTK
jgi:hypothetical protein